MPDRGTLSGTRTAPPRRIEADYRARLERAARTRYAMTRSLREAYIRTETRAALELEGPAPPGVTETDWDELVRRPGETYAGGKRYQDRLRWVNRELDRRYPHRGELRDLGRERERARIHGGGRNRSGGRNRDRSRSLFEKITKDLFR